jgi:hypothetical protein
MAENERPSAVLYANHILRDAITTILICELH